MGPLLRKAHFLRNELSTWEGIQETDEGKKLRRDTGTWINAARYLAPEIILRLSRNGEVLLWINIPGAGTLPPTLKAIDAWIKALPHSDGETATDAIASLRRSILDLGPESRKHATKMLSSIERMLRAQ